MGHDLDSGAPRLGARPARRRSPFWLRLGVALAGAGLIFGALARGVDRVREAAARQS
jgi:hypothetical protein